MQIDEIRTYKSAFNALGKFSLLITIVSFILSAGVAVYFFNKAQTGYQSIWIVDPKSHTTIKADQVISSANPEREFEYRNHVEMFYHNWFEFDQYTYKEHIDKAFNYLGNSGPAMLNEYNSQDWARKLIEKNMKCTVQIDSILFDMNSTPVRGGCYAIQTIETPAGKVRRRINAQFTMHDLEGRSIQNPHGCLIDNFQFFDQSKIEDQQP